MNKQLNKNCTKCGSNDVVLTKQDKSFVSCNNCKYKVNLVVTPEDKSSYSIGDGLHTAKENRETLLKVIIKYSKPKKYPVGDMEEFYDYMPSFIKYPTTYLNEFAEKFEKETESTDDLKRLIGLLKMDNLAIDIAIASGIHPITGCKWDNNDRMVWHRYNSLKDRNTKMITHIIGMLAVIETPPHESTYEIQRAVYL